MIASVELGPVVLHTTREKRGPGATDHPVQVMWSLVDPAVLWLRKKDKMTQSMKQPCILAYTTRLLRLIQYKPVRPSSCHLRASI